MNVKTQLLTMISKTIMAVAFTSGGSALLLMATLGEPKLQAQASAGLTGTVTDPSGSVVGGATVTIVSKSTGVAITR